jgi:hypothetical protein
MEHTHAGRDIRSPLGPLLVWVSIGPYFVDWQMRGCELTGALGYQATRRCNRRGGDIGRTQWNHGHSGDIEINKPQTLLVQSNPRQQRN